MSKPILKAVIAFFILTLVGCAKRGTITGGAKDTIAPVLKTSFPKNFSTNFKGDKIELVFDEYIKLKNLNKQLIISPPMKNQPRILPQTATRTLTITINDTLKPDTTYSFNFGNSIEDNNEGNPYPQFKYVFSTGSYLDSLRLDVKINDALEKEADKYVSVMLYEINEQFNDSIIYKQVPTYISNTLENSQKTTLENIKEGKYLLVAIKDNGNNKFDPKIDKIGFSKEIISIPNDTIYTLKLFKEKLPFKANKPSQVSKNRMIVGHDGESKNVKITVLNKKDTVPSIITKFPNKDSLQVWVKSPKVDTLKVVVQKEKYVKDFEVIFKNLIKDSLKVNSVLGGIIPLRERFQLSTSTPLVKFDAKKISVFNKDSVSVPFETSYDDFNQKFYLDFKKEPSENYKITLLPGAVEDFYNSVNDTLKYETTTKNISDYGNLKVILENVKRFPVIVELTDDKGKVVASEYSEKNTVLEFLALEPNQYSLRVIYDDNKNKEWDTGSFLEKRQPEEVIYFPKELDIRANWDVEQPFDLKN